MHEITSHIYIGVLQLLLQPEVFDLRIYIRYDVLQLGIALPIYTSCTPLQFVFRFFALHLEAEEAAQNSIGDVNSYTNHGDGTQNITRRKSNSGPKSGDRTTYNITNNYPARPAKKKTPSRNKSPDIRNTPIVYGGSNGSMSFHIKPLCK
ncbi:hypothetical protein VNO80_29459 [Phaseolus coccineus]|uniref:Uncharacterized protein n=1 Tax=Phaseolus coccineus TaxID=3886 RepID=A0AAN9QEX6_PHACN